MATPALWAPVSGYEGLYEVSTHGEVRSLLRGVRTLKPRIHNGYRRVALYRNKAARNYSIPRLMLAAFVPNEGGKTQVNHIDGVKTNDVIRNLEWVTPQENALHAHRTGLAKPLLGERHPASPLKNEDVLDMRRQYAAGMATQYALAHRYGITQSSVFAIVHRKTWGHV